MVRFIDKDNNIIVEKKCLKCLNVKPLEKFNKSSSGKFKRHNYCKACLKIINKDFYNNNRETKIEKSREWNVEHPKKTKEYQTKHRYKINPNIKKRPPEIPDDISIPD